MPRVLVCDDFKDARTLFADLLVQMGLDVDCAETCKDALALARDIHPDLVIANANAPSLTGLELVRELNQDAELANIPSILLSSPTREHEAYQAGCDWFLAKPFELRRLLEMVREIVRPV